MCDMLHGTIAPEELLLPLSVSFCPEDGEDNDLNIYLIWFLYIVGLNDLY